LRVQVAEQAAQRDQGLGARGASGQGREALPDVIGGDLAQVAVRRGPGPEHGRGGTQIFAGGVAAARPRPGCSFEKGEQPVLHVRADRRGRVFQQQAACVVQRAGPVVVEHAKIG
jgi:hypothetical protein